LFGIIKQLLPSMDCLHPSKAILVYCYIKRTTDNVLKIYNPLKAITVLLYRTTDQGLGI
jgi:hypothetical protein